MPRENSSDLKARRLSDTDLLKLAVAFCNRSVNQSFGASLSNGEYVETDSYALASAIESRSA